MGKMNLCIDIGNTSTKAALYKEGEELEYFARFDEQDFLRVFEGQRVLISKTGSDTALEQELQKAGVYHVLDHKKLADLPLDYTTPDTLGTDRIAAAYAAKYLYPNKAILVLDAGTCITLDLVDDKGVFRGGLIAPGVEMRLKAMHEFTAGLPSVEINENVTFPGRSTAESMQVGAYQSVIKELTAFFNSLTEQFGTLVIVDCSKRKLNFDKGDNYQIFAHPKLVLQGLNLIAEQYV